MEGSKNAFGMSPQVSALGAGGIFLRKLRAVVDDRPTGFVWVEEPSLAGSGYPASRAQVIWLVGKGIASILTLTEEPLPARWVEGLRLRTRHVPLRDHQPPGAGPLAEAAEYILGETRAGRPVVVHCLAGEGRTGCVLAAYLIKTRGVGAKEALDALRALKPAFVELKQEKSVYDFATSVGPQG